MMSVPYPIEIFQGPTRGVMSPLAGLRFHDLRHHAITKLAESATSEQTIMAIAGHVSRQMLEHYSHIRSEAKRRAVEALASAPHAGVTSYVTSYSGTSLPCKVM